MENLITKLRAFLSSLTQIVRDKFVKGLDKNIDLWQQESTFNYSTTVTYKYGDFVHFDLCCNVGSEQGGERYGVVIEDSAQLSGTVVVIPVHGSDAFRPAKHFEAYIARPFPFLSKDHHYAIVTQIRSVSKMRIDKKFGKLNSGYIDEIKKVMRSTFKL
jgi:mRNA-degrading endonuclease toxin of MazEF toxin-antitoxin module